MIRAAIYARFSSDRQNDRSVDDQIASCRELCACEGFAVVLTFCDREISGASIANRPGFQDLMRAAEALRFDVIVAEDVDRISRDQGDWHTARKRLDFLGIAIHTASGKVGKLDGALRALMGEMFLENLVVHTRRGLEAVVRSGRHAGGRAYGYRAVAGKPCEQKSIGDDELTAPERRQDLVFDTVPEIRGVQQRKFLGAERAHCLAALDNRFNQIRRVPFRRHDVVAFGFQPRLEQFALRGFAGSVWTFERDQKAAPAGGVTEVGACAQAQCPQRVRRSAHLSDGAS